jgi:outer membrane protein OmpU
MQSASNSVSFFGFRGQEELGGGNFALFSLASFVNLANGTAGQGTSFFNKNAYVGLGNRNYGTVMLGRNDEFAYPQCYLTGFCWLGQSASLHPGNLDRIGAGNLANMIKYASPLLFNSFVVRGYYSFGDSTAGTNSGRAVGGELSFQHGPVSISATYESINGVTVMPLNPAIGFGVTNFFGHTVTAASAFKLDHENIAFLGGRYELGNFVFYLDFSNVDMKMGAQSDGLRTYEGSVGYHFSPFLTGNVGCFRSTFASSAWNTCQVGANYALSKRTDLFLVETFQRASGPNQVAQMFGSGPSSSQTQNAVNLGIRVRL